VITVVFTTLPTPPARMPRPYRSEHLRVSIVHSGGYRVVVVNE